MISLFSLIERVAIGPEPDPADAPVLDLRDGRRLSRRQLTESVLVLASVGKGKTTLAKTFGRAFLRDHCGGLVLTVKGSQVEEVRAMCAAEERQPDLIEFGPGSSHVFNPLQGEESSAEAAALLVEIADLLAARRSRGGGENESFWREQLGIILRNLFVLCRLAHGRHDLLLAADLFAGRANTLADLADPRWQERSPLAAALRLARPQAEHPETRLAVDYFEKDFPALGDRLQGSLAATVASVFDHLCRSPLRELFTGRSTFDMESLLEHAKVCVVALPALDSTAGRIANGVLQHCFCRAAVRRPRKHYSFLMADECQETATHELVRKLAVLREFKVISVLLSQNLAVLDDRLGENLREGLCGLLGLKLFGPQTHAATRQWAAEQIGKDKTPTETQTTSRNFGSGKPTRSKGSSTHEHWDYRVPPSRFASLKVGETICLRDGEVWRARWHRDTPGKRGTVAIAHD